MPLPPDIYFLIALILEGVSHFLFPISIIIPSPYNLIGIILILAGFAMAFHVNLTFMKNKTTIMPYKTPSSLVTTGLFRLSRNPIYLGMASALLGAAVSLGTLSPFIFPLLFMAIIDRLVIPLEEHVLEKKFGREYREYKGKVRRWL